MAIEEHAGTGKRNFVELSLAAMFLVMLAHLPAQANDALVVYIKCTDPSGKTSQGSGVLVSPDGHVLTARHVVPDEGGCVASIGNKSLSKREIYRSFYSRSIPIDIDAALLEFAPSTGEKFPFAKVCRVTKSLKERELLAKGFHPGSRGNPSSSDGILSNPSISYRGIVETTNMTTNGKSGGPIFLRGTDTILGIIAGAEFTATGVVSHYAMLAIDAVTDHLTMLTINANCASVTNAGSTAPRPKDKVIVQQRVGPEYMFGVSEAKSVLASFLNGGGQFYSLDNVKNGIDRLKLQEVADYQVSLDACRTCEFGLVLQCTDQVFDANDLRGQKIRASGALRNWVSRMGAVPIDVDFYQIRSALDRGRIDCYAVPWDSR